MHYTDASSRDLGVIMLVAAVVGIVFSLSVCSIADRYQAYRGVFISTLLIAYVCYTSLFLPVFFGQQEGLEAPEVAATSGAESATNIASVTTQASLLKLTADSTTTSSELDGPELRSKLKSQWWFCLAAICVMIGSMTTTVNMTLSDAFGANLASKSGESYGTLRFYGSLGWILASIVLSFINDIPSVPFLVPALCMYTVLATLNLLLVVFWPDKRPFDLSISSDETDDCRATIERKTSFSFSRGASRFWSSHWTLRNSKLDLNSASVMPSSLEDGITAPVVITKALTSSQFDKQDDEVFRNVRRCSLAPLGDSHIVRQYELDADTGFFKFVTKIDPLKGHNNQLEPGLMMPKTANKVEYKITGRSSSVIIDPEELRSKLGIEPKEVANIGIALHLKTIQLLLTRNKLMLRFLLLYIIIGFSIAMNWYYLFPYIESIDAVKFRSLSAQVMISIYVSEAIFYYVSPRIISSISYSTSLSIVMLLFGLRYALYIPFSLFSVTLPLELIIGVEFMFALNISWFDCIFMQAAIEFADDARACVPDLIRLGYMDNSQQTIDKVNNGFKATMVSISSCCFDGIGVGLGSLVGGWLIEAFGYKALWATVAALSLSVCFINLTFDYMCNRSSIDSKDDYQDKKVAESIKRVMYK